MKRLIIPSILVPIVLVLLIGISTANAQRTPALARYRARAVQVTDHRHTKGATMFRLLDRSIRARRFSPVLPIVIACLSLFILLPHSAEAKPQASIRYVAQSGADSTDCSSAASPCLTVQYAVDQAAAGDAIHIAAGTYSSVTLRNSDYQQVYISQTLTMQGGYTTTDSFAASNPIANPTLLDAQNGGRVLLFSGVNGDVSNLTLQNGNTTGDGGGINASNALTLTDVTMISNTSSYGNGGGAYAGDAATLNGGVFQNNTAGYQYGGGLFAYSTLSLTGTQFISNTSPFGGGGAVVWLGAATLNGGLFQNNTSTYGGGLFAGNTLALTGTQFLNNTAYGGGGVYASDVTLNGGLFQNNTSSYGGGLVALGTLSLTGTQFMSNTSSNGGGAYAIGAATLNGGLFQNNTSSYGGGLQAGVLALTGTQFLSNTASAYGGGGGVYADAATLNGGLFQNNTAGYYGGGLYAGVLSLTGTQFISNAAYRGGGVSAGTVTLNGGLFQNNTAVGGGGGLYANSTLALTDTQFMSNTAANNGGGVYAGGAATLNGAGLQGNLCTAINCTSGGLYANDHLTLTQLVTTTDGWAILRDFTDNGTFTQLDGAVTFEGTVAQSIKGSVPTLFAQLAISNIGAGVSLGQDITVTNRLTLTSDLTTTANYTLTLTASTTMTGTGDVWGRTARPHSFTLGTTYAFGNPSISLDFTNGTPPTGMLFDLQPNPPIGFNTALARSYTITPTGGSSFTATLRLHYRDSELNGNDKNSLALWRNLPGWLGYTPSASDTVNNWLESDSITGFSPWGIASHPAVMTLTVATAGTGSGVVTPTAGVHSYPYGTVVTPTASANTGSTFTGWSGDCSGLGTCALTLTTTKSVTATFTLNSYTLTVAKTGTGSGVVTPTIGVYTYTHGTVIPITATANLYSFFGGWSGDCSGTGLCLIAMTTTKSVTATFTINTYTLTVATAGAGSGVVSPIAGVYSYTYGTIVTPTATANTGSSFTGWSGDCSGTGTCSIAMTTTRSITATFALNTYTLTIAKTGTGSGIVTPTVGVYTYTYGTIVPITATANLYSFFGGWSGDCSGLGACVVTMTTDRTVSASFDQHRIYLPLALKG